MSWFVPIASVWFQRRIPKIYNDFLVISSNIVVLISLLHSQMSIGELEKTVYVFVLLALEAMNLKFDESHWGMREERGIILDEEQTAKDKSAPSTLQATHYR